MPTTQANATQSQVSGVVDFGNGRYSPLMAECFKDLQRVFKLDIVPAEKLARQIGTELGAIMANAPVDVRLGKANKDNKMTVSEAAKVKNLTQTWAILALRAINYANDATRNGVSVKDTSWEMSDGLKKYIAEKMTA